MKSNRLAAALAVVLALSCGKKDDSETTTTNADGSTKLTEVSTADQLGVSAALGSLSLPAAYAPKKTSLLLTASSAKKSSEACMMGDGIKSATEGLASIGSFFCHIEVEKDKISFGKKYKITSSGEEFARIWIDNSKAADNQITLYMCQDGKLREKIDITGVKIGADGKPSGIKGSVQHQGSEGTQSWASSSTFDKGYTGAYLEISSKDKYADSSNSGTFARSVALKLMDSSDEVSSISLASKGTWGGSDFAQRGIGKGASDFGQALFENSGSYQSQTYTWTHRSYFALSTGLVAASDATDKFAASGSLYVKSTELPEYLATGFSPDAPSGWDCEGVESTVDLDPDSAEHQKCDGDHSEGESCWGDDFEQSDVTE